MLEPLKRIPITVKGLLITFTVGILAWAVLDYFQSRALSDIFTEQLEERLDNEAMEDRIRFDTYVKAHHESVRLLVANKGFLDYADAYSKEWAGEPKGVVFHRRPPDWLPKPSVLRSLVRIRYALLLDGEGRVREVYQSVPDPPPGTLLKPAALLRELSHNQSFMTTVENIPMLLASESLRENEEGRTHRPVATLMLANPLDHEFLRDSQRPYHGQIFALIVGLVSLDSVLVSTHPELLPPGTMIEDAEDKYLITGKSFFDYGASDLTLGFASFVPLEEVDSLVGTIIVRDRRQRAVTAFILIMAFAVIMFGITKRIERITGSIATFSREALLGKHEEAAKGDELTVLEDRFHRLTEEVIASREQLVQVEKLSALGRLTANVAHEIRNPLTSIGGFARRLSKKFPNASPEKEDVEIIISEVDNLERILRNVLTYSRESRLTLEMHDPNGIVEECLKMYEQRCRERSIEMEKELGGVPEIEVDGIQVHEALNNLIANAIDSMPNGGTLSVTTREEILSAKPYLVIVVADTGKGIPEDKVQTVFEPFFTTKLMGGGTGLGLPICKKIVEDHGGFIQVKSAVGKGTTFSLYFPYEREEEPETETETEES